MAPLGGGGAAVRELSGLWDTKRAAMHIGVSPKTLYKRKDEWGVPYLKIGTKPFIRYVPDELMRWARGRREGGDEGATRVLQ